MDVTAAGSLRVAVTAGREREDQLYLLRFDVNGTMFDVVPGLVLSNFYAPLALKRRGGRTPWIVYPGPEIAVDKVPGGPHEGRLYAAWAQPQSIVVDATVDFGRYGRDFDVWLAHSDDDGVSWSTPIKVNDDGTTADQFFPSLRIDTAGTVHVAFVDRRENPDVAQFDVYYALAVDGRISRNVRVNGQHVAIDDRYGGREVGDYLDTVVAHPTRSYVAYPCLSASGAPADACVAAIDPARFPPSGDLFKCYRAPATTGFVPRTVMLRDRFEQKLTKLLKADSLRNPAAALGCYRIKDAGGQPRFVRRDVAIDGEFGSETATVTRGRVLCVPSTGS